MANLYGTGPNQVPLNSMLGNLAFQDKAYVSVDKVGIGTTFVDSGTEGQILQVYGGGAYVSGSVGIGTTNPTQPLDVEGNVRLRSGLYDFNNQVGVAGSILVSTGAGVSWSSSVGTGAQGLQGNQGLSNQGVQGNQGLQGLSNQGAQGTQGLGSQGLQGNQGTQGLQGLSNQGAQGAQGSQGVQGRQGLQGVQGLSNQGAQGAQGSQGVQGLSNQGAQGTQGLQGAQGNQGVQGLSNQGSQGLQGNQGNQGVQGLSNQGSQGLQGNQGNQGVQGLSNQGSQGLQGRQGLQGVQGLSNQGLQGTQGLSNQGLQGLQGRQGLQGVQSAQGLQGVQGILGNTPTVNRTVGVSIDGGGSAITTGTKGYVEVPYSGTIIEWKIISDISGSAVFDVWKANAAIPTNANTITASAKPTLTSSQRAASTTLTGWTTGVSANDVFGFEVESASTITKAVLILVIQQT